MRAHVGGPHKPPQMTSVHCLLYPFSFFFPPFPLFFFSPRSELSGVAAVAAGRSGRRRQSRAARLGGCDGAARQGAWTGAARRRRRGSSLPGARIDVAAAARSTDVAAAGSASPGCGGLAPPWAVHSPVGEEDDGVARIRRRLSEFFLKKILFFKFSLDFFNYFVKKNFKLFLEGSLP